MARDFSRDMGRYLLGRQQKTFLRELANKAKNKVVKLKGNLDEATDTVSQTVWTTIEKKKEDLRKKKEKLQKKRELTQKEKLEKKKTELKLKQQKEKERFEQKKALEEEKQKVKQQRQLAKAQAREERKKLKKQLAAQKAALKEQEQLAAQKAILQEESPPVQPPQHPISPAAVTAPKPRETTPPPENEQPSPGFSQIDPDALNVLLETSKKLGERMDEIASKVDIISTKEEPKPALPPLSELPLPPQELPRPPEKKSLLGKMFKPSSKPSKVEEKTKEVYDEFKYEAEDEVNYAGNILADHEEKKDWQHLQQEEINAIKYAVASGKHKEEIKLNTFQDKKSDWQELNPEKLESFEEQVEKKRPGLFGFISVKRVSEIEREEQQAEKHEEMQATSDYLKAQEILDEAVPQEDVRYNEPLEEHEDPFADLEEEKQTKRLNKEKTIKLDDDYHIEVVEHE